MEHAFLIVVIAVGIVGVLGAIVALVSSPRAWESIGDRGAGAPHPDAERDAEIRQMLEARNARRRRRGEPEQDVEAELRRLIAAPAPRAPADGTDPALRDEIRELVVARNHRRARRGEPPLDVDAEVARELDRLSG